MHTADHATHSVPNELPQDVAKVGDLARGTYDYVRAWSALLTSETQLARASAVRLVIAALVIPALLLMIGVAANVLIAAVLDRWLHDWSACIAIALFLDMLALYSLVAGMRRWWHNLSLPRSRGALTQLLERIA